MLNQGEFKKIKEDLKGYEEKREEVIRLSREVIQASKQIIYALQRDDPKRAEELIKTIKEIRAKIPEKTYDAGIQQVAHQEFVEALTFYAFLKNKKIPTRAELKVDTENYLMGLCDLTGELM
jgi:translin